MASVDWCFKQIAVFLLAFCCETLAQRWDSTSPLSNFACLVAPATNSFQPDQPGPPTVRVLALHGPRFVTSNVTFERLLSFGSDGDFPANHEIVSINENTTVLRLPRNVTSVGAYTCLHHSGDHISRITTLLQETNLRVRPFKRSIRVSVNDSFSLRAETDVRKVIWRKHGDAVSDWKRQSTVDVEQAQALDAGLYECHLFGKRADGLHGIMEVIVRACPAGFWGEACDRDCLNCFNGGICDDVTGECACLPGFMGRHCENALGSDVFGQLGQFQCSSGGTRERCNHGALICMGHPLGCSCAAGFSGWDCKEACTNGTFGADCEQKCHCRDNALCRGDTGSCELAGGCIDGWTGDTCQVPVQRLISFTAPNDTNIGTTVSLSCTAAVNFTDNTLSLGVMTAEGNHLLTKSVKRDASGQTQTVTVAAEITRALQNFTCNLATSRGGEQTTVIVSGHELPVLSRPPEVRSIGSTWAELSWHAWTSGVDIGDGPVIAYRVKYKEQGTADWQMADTVTSQPPLTLRVTPLESRLVYDFAVVAIRPGPGGEGTGSHVVSARTSCPAPDPVPGLQVSAIEGASRSLHVTLEPTLERRCQVDHYIIHYVVNRLDQCRDVTTPQLNDTSLFGFFNTTEKSVIISNLHEYSTYRVTVTPVKGRNLGQNTTALGTTGGIRPTLPPSHVEVTELSTNEVTMSWGDVPCGHRKGAIENYLVMLRGAHRGTEIVPSSKYSFTFQNILECTLYNFTIAAYNAQGVGPYSPAIPIVIPATVAPEPIRHLRITPSATEVHLSWDPPVQSACPLTYTITYTTQVIDQCLSQLGETHTLSTVTTRTEYTIRGLRPFSTYSVEVTTRNSIGQGLPVGSTFRTAESAPENVTQLTVVNVTEHSISLSWELQCGNKHGDILLFSYALTNENAPVAALTEGETASNVTAVTIEELAACTPYEFRVKARNSAGYGRTALVHHIRTLGEVPGQIENMAVHTYPSRPFEADVTWSPPEAVSCPILYYKVSYVLLNKGMCEAVSSRLRQLTHAGNTSHWFIRLSNLQPFSSYEVYVQAVSDAGMAPVAKRRFQTQAAVPAQIKQVTLGGRGQSSLRFRWRALECGRRHGPEVVYHYRLEAASGGVKHGQVHEPQAQVTVPGLMPCETYTFNVWGETMAGIGPTSSTVSAGTAPSPPGPVTSLDVNTLGSSSLNVTWRPPSSLPCPIVGYGVRYYATDKDQCNAPALLLESQTADVETTEHSAVLYGLAPFTTYNVTVWARTRAPEAGLEELTSIITSQDAPTASPIVNEATSFLTNPNKLNISWDEVPCGHRRGNISFYSYDLESMDDNVRKAKTSKIPAFKRWVTLDDLEPCESYNFRVRARTKKGWGPYSSWKKLTVDAVVSGPVHIVVAETSSTNPTSIRLSWQPPPNQKCPISNYVVKYRLVREDRCLVDDDWPIEELSVEADHTDVEINLLKPFSTYELNVFAASDAGNGSMATVVVQTGETVPTDAPEAVTVDLITAREIEYSWREPPCGGRHGDMVHYEYRLLNTRDGSSVNATTPDTSIRFGLLIPFTEYRFRVRASTARGFGPLSEELVSQTLVAPPPKPREVKVIGIGETNVTIQWSKPDPPHGIITEYAVQYWRKTESKPNHTVEFTIRSDDDEVNVSISNLTPYTAYVIQVRGVTSAGPGDWSDAVRVGTSEGLPGPVTQVRVLNRTLTSIELIWGAPKSLNGRLEGYTISYAPLVKSNHHGNRSTKRPLMELRKSTSSHALISELEPATEYIFRISANNRVGDGIVIVLTEFTKVPIPVVPKSPGVSSRVTENNMVTIQLEPMKEGFVSAYRVTVQRINEISKRAADYQGSIPPYYPGHYLDSSSHWIAAEFSQHDLPTEFIVGDNRTYGGYHNAPLSPGNSYGISMCSVSRTSRDMAASCSHPIEVKAKPNLTTLSNASVFPNELKAALGVIVLVVFVAALIVAVIRRRKRLHTTRPKEGIGLSALEAGGEGGASMSNGTSSTLPALSRAQGVYKAKPRGHSVMAVQNGQSLHNIKRGNGAMRQRPKTAPKPANPASMRSRWQAPPAVKIAELSSYVKEKTANGEMCFKLDYERLPDGQMYTWEVATRQENVAKNRYINIIPYDHSRVILDTSPDVPHEDYINASYVSGYLRPKAYIATQGPLTTTVVDFWRMVWQEKIPIIVMLTKLVENKKRKCDPYWPDDIETYGDFTVTVIAERNYHNYTERTLTIRKAWDPEERRVQHFHYTSWPDMGLPVSATPLLDFIHKVKEFEARPSGPTVVHCSAGVGRTGTYITLDSMMDMSAREQQINVLDFIYRMRTKRVKMVQTPEQYVFIYEALLEYLLCGYTSVPTKSIVPYFTRMEQTNLATKRTFLEEHLNALDAMSIRYHDTSMQAGGSAENRHKNRYPDIIPLDKYRPYLMTGCAEGQTNYVNATFLDGFRKRDMYIATQMPLPHTVEDFWRMIYDYNSNVIVMINEFNQNDKTCSQYWPAGDEALIGPFIIDVSAEEREGDVIIRTLLLANTNNVNEPSRVIRQYQFIGWKERQKYPRSLSSLLCLLDMVEAGQRDVGDGPITVHCMDGVRRSGLFCAIMSTVSKLKTEGNIDVFHAVKKLKKCSGNMISTEEEYLYIHDVVREYLASCEIYENFR
ncbi:receptor-type tyrosine-protein phosphatase delta-like [Diadema antillarum]|uniref:receptor-type tyrosine-protein phosphatase delta-like n=1 Tax=Diadema antillarum TaxID=105358 RepID=UPI003A89C16C